MPRFDVVLSYDLGNGVRIVKGGQTFTKWPSYKEGEPLPKSPRAAVEFLTHYFRYTANLARVGRRAHLGRLRRQLRPPRRPGAARRAQLRPQRPRPAHARVVGRRAARRAHAGDVPRHREPQRPAPPAREQHPGRAGEGAAADAGRPEVRASRCSSRRRRPRCRAYANDLDAVAQQLSGATLALDREPAPHARVQEAADHARRPRAAQEAAHRARRQRPDRVHRARPHARRPARPGEDQAVDPPGHRPLAAATTCQAMPMGYLLCGPVGTGKTFMVECHRRRGRRTRS